MSCVKRYTHIWKSDIIAADVRNIQILPVSWKLNTSRPTRHTPLLQKCKPPGVCLPYVLVLHTFPEQTAETAQHSTREHTTQQENTQHNKQYSIMWPPEHKKLISFWPSHQTAWRNSKAPIACGDGQRTPDRNNSGSQEKIQKYNRPEMDTTTHNTLNIKRLGESHT